jgi:hypothetical protein
MSNTRRYIQLSRRINTIENAYLPAVNPLGNYSSKQQDDLRAYLLLVHAEIEAYFEEISENKAKSAFRYWELNRTMSNVLLALVSFCENSFTDQELETRINKALTSYIHKLKKNHGIRERNLLEILLPVGIEYSSIDTTWLNTMTFFGSNRGDVAHSTASVQQPLDPVILKNSVTLILAEINNIHKRIKALK